MTVNVLEGNQPAPRRVGPFTLLGLAAITTAGFLSLAALLIGPFELVGVLWAGMFVLLGTILSLFIATRALHQRPTWLQIAASLVGGWILSAPLEALLGLATREHGEATFLPEVWLWGLVPLLIAEVFVVAYAVISKRMR